MEGQWYQYHINWYRYPQPLEYQCIFGTDTTLTGTSINMRSLQDVSEISILVQGHAHLSISTSRSLMRILFKPT